MIMTLEERLNEIVEKQQGDAIIPFCKGLTQEERKRWYPSLNKLEEHYSNSCNLTRTHTVHGKSPDNISIINLTALVIYSLKEFRKTPMGNPTPSN